MEANDGMHTHVNQKNAITLPQKVLQILQLNKGDAVLFKQMKGKVYIAKGKVEEVEQEGTND